MTTAYTHSITLACPSSILDGGNCLAALLGPNPEGDMHTFRQSTYTKYGTEYAVSHTVVKPDFLKPTQTGTLPDDPTAPPDGYNRDKAEQAFASINTEGGILMAVDVDPHAQFEEWGLEIIPSEYEL